MSSPRLVFLDNTSSDIQYGPSWVQQTSTSSAVYLGTLQATDKNTSFSFQFTGTAINVVGSINIKKVNGEQDPRWECYVDQQPIKLGSVGDGFVEDAWSLCSTRDIPNTNHTFTLYTISRGSTFYLDSLSYQPSQEADVSRNVVRINNDDGAIKYAGKFGPLGDFANMTLESGASVSVDFIGKSLTWYGFIPTELPHAPAMSAYSIDGGPPNTFRLGGLSNDKSSSLRNQVFFTTPELNPGPHTIVVTHGGNTSTTPLVLDYLLVTNSTTLPKDGSHKSVPVGAIVGGIIGGLVLLGALCFAVYFFTRRRELTKRWRRQTMRSIDASFHDPETETLNVSSSKSNRRIAPFVLRPNHRPTNSDASATIPLFATSDADYTREPTSSVAAYTSHQNGLFLAPPESAGTIDQFNLASPTPSTRQYEQAMTMIALQGPTKGALQAAPASVTPVVVQNYDVDSGYRVSMRPDEDTGMSLVQVVDVSPVYRR